MRVWVIKYGETVPLARADGKGRLMRAGAVAKCLAERGHQTTWWTGRFEHQSKQHLTASDHETITDPNSGLQIKLIDSPGYNSNISFARWRDHKIFVKNLKNAMEQAEKPDIIVASFPLPEVVFCCVDFGKRYNIPIVIDVRDKWPEIIVQRLRDRLGYFPQFLVRPYSKKVSRAFENASALYSITKPFLEWAQEQGNRPLNLLNNDHVFHLASRSPEFSKVQLGKFEKIWADRGLKAKEKVVFCWAGSLTPQKTVENMLDAFGSLPTHVAEKIQMVICGDGVLEPKARQLAASNDHILFPGFIPNDEVKYLYTQSHMGLLCYDDDPSFSNSFPNKFGEYLSCGLPILTTLTGHIKDTFFDHPFCHSTGGSTCSDIQQSIIEIVENGIDDDACESALSVHKKHFNTEQIVPDYCRALELLVQEGQKQSQNQ